MDGFTHEGRAIDYTTCFRDPSDAASVNRIVIHDRQDWDGNDGAVSAFHLFQRPEIDFPNYQRQTMPEGTRGRHVRLIKVDTIFSKQYHNFESVHVDMSEIVDVDSGFHSNDCYSRPQQLVLYSDGISKVESHGYGTIIGRLKDAECRVGILGFRHTPRLGMGWAGLMSGNDVCLAASGIESQVEHNYDMSLRGHTNGHLLFVNIVLELV